MTLKTLDRAMLDADPDQPRQDMDSEELKQLALSIRDLGQLQPVIVYRMDDRFRLVDGHRRHAALALLGHETVSAIVLEQAPDADTLLMTQLAANCMRVGLKPTERARAYQRLKESRGWTNSALAEALHVSKSTVTLTLSYLKLPEALQTKLDKGELAGSTAYTISRAPDGATKQELIAKATQGSLKRNEAQSHASRRRDRRHHRVTFELEAGSVTVATREQLGLPELTAILKQLQRECRKGTQHSWDVTTLMRVVADEHRATTKQLEGAT